MKLKPIPVWQVWLNVSFWAVVAIVGIVYLRAYPSAEAGVAGFGGFAATSCLAAGYGDIRVLLWTLYAVSFAELGGFAIAFGYAGAAMICAVFALMGVGCASSKLEEPAR